MKGSESLRTWSRVRAKYRREFQWQGVDLLALNSSIRTDFVASFPESDIPLWMQRGVVKLTIFGLTLLLMCTCMSFHPPLIGDYLTPFTSIFHDLSGYMCITSTVIHRSIGYIKFGRYYTLVVVYDSVYNAVLFIVSLLILLHITCFIYA